MSKLIRILAAVARERRRQDDRWGEQNHPDGTGNSVLQQVMADAARKICDNLAAQGALTWMHILREEVFEAFAESDEDKLVAELIQVQAVAAAWIEAIYRRHPEVPTP